MFSIKYSVYEKADLEDEKNLTIRGVLNILKEKGLNVNRIIFINSIFVSKNNRNNGLGSTVLKDLIKKYPGSIIVTEAFASKEEYERQPNEYENEKIVKNIGNFLTKNGFYDINDYVGKYEYKKVYIYDEFYKNIISQVKPLN